MYSFDVTLALCFLKITYINSVYVPNDPQTPRPYTNSLKVPHAKNSNTPLYHSSYSKVYVHNDKNYSSSINSLHYSGKGKQIYPVYSADQKKKTEEVLQEHNANIVNKDTLNNRVVFKRRIEKSKQIPVYNTCPKSETGIFVYDLSCNQYLDCYKGRGGPRNCAPGTLFNPKSLECDFPDKVECITGPGKTINIVQRSAKLKNTEQATCPEGFSGLIPNYTDCYRFIQCNNGQPFPQTCPPGTLFDMTLNICNFPDKCVCFSGQPAYLEQKEGTDYQYGRRHQAYQSGGWSQQSHGSYASNSQTQTPYNNQELQYVSCDPNKYDCSQYYQSRTGCNPIEQDCERTRGQYAENQGESKWQTATYTQQNTGFPINCDSEQQNCGNTVTRPAKKYDTICNINDKNCYGGATNLGHQSGYNQDGKYHDQSSTQQSGYQPTGSGGAPKCPHGFQGITKHPTDCKKFLNCANGITYIQDCAPGTLFNPLNNICDFPYNVKCKEGGGVNEDTNNNYIPPEYHRSQPYATGGDSDQSYGYDQQGNRHGKCQGQSCRQQGGQTVTNTQTGHQGQWNQQIGGIPYNGESVPEGLYINSTGYYHPKPSYPIPSISQYTPPQPSGTSQQSNYGQVICQPGQRDCQSGGHTVYSPSAQNNHDIRHGSTTQVACNPGEPGCQPQGTSCPSGQNCQPIKPCPPGYSCQPIPTPPQGANQPTQINYQPGGYQMTGNFSGGYNISQPAVVPCHPNQQGCTPIQGTVQPPTGGHRIKKVYVVEEIRTDEGGYGNVYPLYEVQEVPNNLPEAPQIGGSTSYVPPGQVVKPQAQNRSYSGSYVPPTQSGGHNNRPSNGNQVIPTRPGGQTTPFEMGGYKNVQPINKDDERTYQGYSSQRLPDYVDIFDPSETRGNSLASPKKPKTSNNVDDQQVAYSFPEYVFEYEDGEQVTLAPENIIVEKKKKTKCEKGDFKCNNRECLEKIFVCDEVKDCADGRDEKNCKDYINQFKAYENSRLDVLEKQRYDNVTQFTCALLCIQNRQFQCKSFNYRKIDRACFLTDETIGQSGALQTYYPCDYYERKSTAMDCSDMHKCSNGKCLTSKQVCDGFDDCGNREDEKGCRPDDFGYEVKLTGSNSENEGRVEVSVFNQTGYICDDQFSIADANVVCRELGFPLGASEVKGNSYFAKEIRENHTLYMMDDIECIGNETSLMDCNFAGWGIHNCGDFEIAGVVCKTPEEECGENFWKCDTGHECVRFQFVCDDIDDCTDNSDEANHHCDAPTEVRLVNGTTAKEGRLEVRHHGIWGTVCDDDFNEDAAKIACKYLGYLGSAMVKKDAYYGSGTGPIWLDQVSCLGNETALEQCTHWEWGTHNCDHSEDVGIICSATASDVEAGQIAKNSKNNKDQYVATERNPDPRHSSVEPESCGYRKDNIFLQSDDVHFRVIQGSLAKPGDYPWQAALKIKVHEKTAHWCGAVVISSKWVLTAAHCLEGYPKGAYIVVAGEYNIDENEGTEQQAFIEEYYIHELFRQGHKMGNDIALIKLKGAGFRLNQDIQPICLPDENTNYDNEQLNCTISGFGTIQTGKSAYSHQLRAAWIPIQKLDICKMAHIYGEQIGDGMICAGDLDGGVDACDGDSGGPLACLENGVFTLYGVTSWGQRCGYANKPGVYVKVSHYKKWIDSVVSSHSQNL